MENGRLVISRKRNQSFMIGDDIEVIVVEADFGKAKLLICAPKDIPVHRREIYELRLREALERAAKEVAP